MHVYRLDSYNNVFTGLSKKSENYNSSRVKWITPFVIVFKMLLLVYKSSK